MNIHWAHAGPSFVASFLACLVECIEALTVVLAVGSVRSWSGALRSYVLINIDLYVMPDIMWRSGCCVSQ